MLCNKIQPQNLILEKIFKCFLPFMGMVAILFDGAKLFEYIGNTFLTEGPCEIW